MAFLDLIFPKRCVGCGNFGSYICDNCFTYIKFSEYGFCTVCQKASIDRLTHPGCRSKYEIDGVFASVLYKGIMKRVIARFKYEPYVSDLRHILSDLFYEGLIQNEVFSRLAGEKCLPVPIPLHASRYRERGFNQAKLLLEGFLERLQSNNSGDKGEKSNAGKKLLIRIKHTKRQFGLTQADRVANIKDAFAVDARVLEVLNKDMVVFLVDDIVTSGATMREASRVLKKAGFKKVYGIALAHG